jgi:hypothetical protein
MRPNMTSLTKAIIILLTAAIVLNILSIFVINNVNINIVNSTLYDYGLEFSWNWAGQYWSYSNLLLGSVASCIILIALAWASLFFLGKTQGNGPRLFGYFTLALGTAVNFLSIIAFLLIDKIVNTDLYSYSLQFNLSWYEPYFSQGNYFLAMQIFSVTLVMISFVLVFLTRPSPIRINSPKIISLFLLILGVFLVGFSLFYISSTEGLPTPALVGLGLIFWGMIIGYISSEEYVKREVFEATNLSYLTTLNEMMQKLHLKETAVFLPIRYLSGSKSNKVYLVESKTAKLDNIKEILQKASNNDPLDARLMVAPGNELLKLFEKTLGKSFANVDFSFFETNMPKLLINELEIAQNVEIEGKGNIVQVKIKNLVTEDFSKELNEYETTVHSLGIPLSSAIACALANCTNNPTVINNHKINVDEKTTEIEFLLIKEKGA